MKCGQCPNEGAAMLSTGEVGGETEASDLILAQFNFGK